MSTNKKVTEPTQYKSLRLWPGIIIVILQCLIRFVIPLFVPKAGISGLYVGVILGLALVIWWVFFSKASLFERWFPIVLMVVALFTTSQILHKSIAEGMSGFLLIFYSIPILSLAFVVWAVVSRSLNVKLQRVTMIVTILLASVFWAFLRTNGMSGEIQQDFVWRWTQSEEDRLLNQSNDKLVKIPFDSIKLKGEAVWPGFRGLNRDGIIHGVRIKTNWSKTPPIEMWRRSIGPGCSSFAVQGSFLYTQEQRGEYEMVTCYNLNTGDPIWRHSDSTRFWDSHAGAGPRSTPTFSNGRVYTLGATGILNVLDACDGTVIWSRNAAKDTEVKIPGWGYTSSPLVVDSTVFVAIAGQLLAYDSNTGKQRWSGTDGGESYNSPHLLTIGGVKQVLFINSESVNSYNPSDGKLLWKFVMTSIPIIQPALVNESSIIVNEGNTKGLKRISVKNISDKWIVEECWTAERLKPYFFDFIIHKDNVYGFDGPSLVCVDIEKGDLKWKGRRYGGQILLLADQDILLVLSEKGELALVRVTPEQFEEFAKFPAIKGKTWNHPVLVGNILVVRNTQEMAAFRLPLEDS